MVPGGALLVGLLGAATVPPVVPVSGGPAASGTVVEGPTEDPAAVAWQRRDRRLRGATYTMAGITGASLIALVTAGALFAVEDGSYGGGGLSGEAAALIGTGVCFAASLLGTVGTSVLLVDHRRERPSSVPAPSGPRRLYSDGELAVPFAGVAIARGVHRRPLRRWRMTVGGGGLRLEF